MAKLKLKFDPNQEHQLIAIESVVQLFEGMEKSQTGFQLGDDAIPNLPPFSDLNEEWLLSNLQRVQRENLKYCKGLSENRVLETDDGMMLDGVSDQSVRYPSFTIEMETGTGKTYVYLRTIYELKKNFNFTKFIIIVPSIAIYEGTIKTFEITKDHFNSLYGNETINVIKYDGSQLNKLRPFSSSNNIEVMIMTLDSFNKSSNVIYKPTERLQGEKLPYQYIQETRPILILDEAQNYTSEKSKQALRTLNPLFALKYSATPKEATNLVYSLSPVDALKMNLVKKIEVLGAEETNNLNQYQLALEKIEGYGPQATIRTVINVNGERREASIQLKKGDSLYEKTRISEFKGIKVDEINRKDGMVIFTNSDTLFLNESSAFTKVEIFRTQIEETIREHLRKQKELRNKGIKVLSLFFIDKVANYISDEAILPKLFDNAFNNLKVDYSDFEKLDGKDVREAYFAKKKNRNGQFEVVETR